MNERILVTGAQGFLGRYVTAALIREFPDAEILGIGRSPLLADTFTHAILVRGKSKIAAPLPFGFDATSNDRYQYLSVDTNDKGAVEKLIRTYQPTVIVHLASGLKGDQCGKLLRTNITGTLNLLSACRWASVKTSFIAVSSGGVYGFPSKADDLPFLESQPCNPGDPYQFAKAAEEQIVKECCQQFSIPWMILRVFNIIGPGQDERHVCGYFVSELTNIMKGYGQPSLKTSGLSSIRDFIDVRDVASNIIRLIPMYNQYDQIFNISSGRPVVIKDILDNCLHTIFGAQRDMVQVNTQGNLAAQAPEIDQHYGSNAKLLAAGGAIDFSLSASISDMVAYYNAIYEQAVLQD